MAPSPGCRASSAGRSLAMRKSETARAPGSSIIGGRGFYRMRPRPENLLLGPRLVGGVVHPQRELRDVAAAFERADLGLALLLHFVDAQDRVHRQHRALDPGELGLDAFLARVQDDGRALPENQLFNLDEPEQATLAHLAGINLVNLALVHEHNLENVTGCHR